MKLGTALPAYTPAPRSACAKSADSTQSSEHLAGLHPTEMYTRPTIVPDGMGSRDGHLFSWTPPNRFQRGLEVVQITGALAQSRVAGPLKLGVAGLNGAASVATFYAGVHDLVEANDHWDRLAGVGALALAADCAISAGTTFSGPNTSTGLSKALGAIYGASDLILGTYDFTLGLKEKDKNYAAAGLFQAAMGAGVLASLAVPALAPVGDAILFTGLVGRQLAFERELFQRKHAAAHLQPQA